MKTPKYIDRLLKRREYLAKELNDVDASITVWLKKNEVKPDQADFGGGVKVCKEPHESAERVRDAISRAKGKATA